MTTRKIAYLLLMFWHISGDVSGQCGLANPIPIADLGTQYGYIRIENATIDDLGSAGQGVCAVNIQFEHETVGDVSLTLSSPNGRVYQLIRAGGSRSTEGTLWNIRFVSCSEPAVPDQGNFIKPVWDSDQDWGENQTYNGTYHAETCLDQINLGPVNGIWTITARDVTGTGSGRIESFSIEFCDSRGIQCSECILSGGRITVDTTFVCGGEAILGAVRIFPTYTGVEPDPSEYAYRYLVINGGIIRQIAELPDLQSSPKGDYRIYGISIANQDLPTLLTYDGQSFSSLTNALAVNRLGFCAAFSNGYKVYRILSDPDPRTIVNAYVCAESPLLFDGDEITAAGVYTATLTSVTGCDSIVELRVEDFQVSNRITDPGVISCNNKPLTLSWQNNQFETNPALRWFTQDGSILTGERTSNAQIDLPGTYGLAISQRGCADTLMINISSDGTLPQLLVDDIVMNCTQNIGELRPVSNAISFSWSGPFGYSSSNQNIDVTEPGEYVVTAEGTNCAVRKRVQVGADFTRPENITATGGAIRCANDSVQLAVGSSTPGVSFQWSGPNGFSSTEANPWVNERGIYIVRIGAGGCAEERQVEVHNLFNSPNISITGATIDCRNTSKRITTTISDPLAQFQWSGPDGFSSAAKSPVITHPGNYSVQVIDANNCLYTSSATVTIDTVKPSVSVSDISLTCPQNSFTLSAIHSSLHPPQFRWTGPGNFVANKLDTSATQVGNYTIVVTDPVNGCSDRATLVVNPDPRQPTIVTRHANINCDRPLDTLIAEGNCTGGCIYEWTSPDGSITSDDSLIVGKRGNYTVKVTDLASGCESWAGILVRKDTIPLQRNVRVQPIGCTTEGMITLDNINEIRDFSWIDTLSLEAFNSPTVNTRLPRVLALQSTDINGCDAESFYAIPIKDDAPVLAIRSDSLDCAQDSVVLGVSITNYASSLISSYRWRFADGSAANIANPRVGTPGPVDLQVTMRNGCEGGVQGIVDTDFVTPLLDARGGGFACLDTGINLTVAVDRPALSTYWTGPNGFQSFSATPLATVPGLYTVEILGYNGCPAMDTALVYYTDPIPNLQAFGDTINCIDTAGNISFDTDAAPGYSYRWLDPGGRTNSNAEIITTLVGPYQVELTDLNGCRVIATAEIDIDTISFGHTIQSGIISCNDPVTQLLLDTVFNFLEYRWTFDSMTISDLPQPLVDTGGLFILTTTNTNGCQRHITYQVEADTVSPNFTLNNDTLNCENTRINLRPFPASGAWEYQWTGPGDFTFDRATPLITGPGRYTVTATASNGCGRTTSANIEASFEAPEIFIDSTFIPCNADSARLSFFTTDSLKETNWFGPDGYYQPTADAATDNEGWYYLLAKGFNGCEAFDSQYVSSIPLLAPLQVTTQKIDCSHSMGFVSIDSMYSGYRYYMINEVGDTFTTSYQQTAQEQVFQIVAEHVASGCDESQRALVPVDTIPPDLEILEMDSIICDHREIQLGSSTDTAVIYQWSTSDGRLIGPTNNAIARLDLPGSYTLRVTSVFNDCTSEESIQVDEKFSDLQSIYTSTVDASCDGQFDAIISVDSLEGGQGPFTFSLDNDFFTSQNAFLFLEPKTYQLQVKDVNGCFLDTIITVGRYPGYEVSLGTDEILVNLGDSLTLDVTTDILPSNIGSITWLTPDSINCVDCLSQTFLPTDNRYYYLIMTSSYGCVRRDTVFIRVADPGRIFVPNAFTPNNDGVNDFLEVFTGDDIEHISSFEVFDRWGNSVFLAVDFREGDIDAQWDGNYRGEPLNPGVYIYQLKAVDIRGTVKTKVGEINLLR